MKRLTCLFSLIVSTVFIFSSCKKDKIDIPAPTFDINNPVGYMLVIEYPENDPRFGMVYEFAANNNLYSYNIDMLWGGTYKIKGNTIEVDITASLQKFTIENNQVIDFPDYMRSVRLVRIPATNQLAGKTFKGTYYNRDGTVLHQNFFYKYAASSTKVEAGFSVGTPVRTENYHLYGNIVSRVAVAGTNDVEFMVLVDGKLEVSYYQSSTRKYLRGQFIQQ